MASSASSSENSIAVLPGRGWLAGLLALFLAVPAPAADALVDQARAQLKAGDAASAEKTLVSAGKDRSGDAAALLGTLLLQSGRTAEALPALEEACAKLPKDPFPRGLRAVALSSLGRDKEALEQAEEARRLEPKGSLDALRLLSDLHAKARRWPELVKVCSELAALAPGDGVARFRAALGEAGQGRWPKAREWAIQATKADPKQPRTWLLLSKIEKKMGLKAQAKKSLDQAQAAGLTAADLMEAELGGVLAPGGKQ